MWPFSKKKEKEHTPTPEERQVQEFAQKFLPEEFVLVAVTGPEGAASDRNEDEPLWTLTCPLTAWMDEFDGVVTTGSASLQILADERLRDYLRHHLPGSFIIKARVRPGREEGLFQLVGMPEPGFDPELKAILDEQIKPVTLETEDLGTFTLVRHMNWFESQIDWPGQSVQLTFNQDEDQEDSLTTARALLTDPEGWDARLRAFAADRLLDAVNEQGEDPVSREELLESLCAETVHVGPKGAFALWYGSDLFIGQAARIMGTLETGPADAKLED